MNLDLTTFFFSISSAALMGLGLVPREGQKEPQIDLRLAQYNIELLELMKLKTEGNRTAQESELLTKLLIELKMRFVEVQGKSPKS